MAQTADELRQDIEATRGDLGNTLDAIGDRVSPGRVIERRKNRMTRSLSSLRDRVMGPPSTVASRAGQAASGAAETVRHAPEAVKEGTEGSPLLAGALAFGAGFLIASVLPVTEEERKAGGTIREKVEPLAEELKEAGHEAAEHLREPARMAAEEMRQVAQESGREVKATAEERARQAKVEAQEATTGSPVPPSARPGL